MELRANAVYSGNENWLSWWRTSGGVEIDFILGGEIAVEVKSTENPTNAHLNLKTGYAFKILGGGEKCL